jgi:hypothetical protein
MNSLSGSIPKTSTTACTLFQTTKNSTCAIALRYTDRQNLSWTFSAVVSLAYPPTDRNFNSQICPQTNFVVPYRKTEPRILCASSRLFYEHGADVGKRITFVRHWLRPGGQSCQWIELLHQSKLMVSTLEW